MKRLLDNDRQREAAKQNRLIAIAQRRFSVRFQTAIRRAMLQMLAQYRATGSAPQLPEGYERRIEALFYDMIGVTVQGFGNRILDQGKAAGLVLERKNFAEAFIQWALEYIAQEAIRRRIQSITNTTRETIIGIIQRGARDGLGIDAIASQIEEAVPEVSRLRGHIIARTETHAAANYGADRAARATGLKLRKEWVSVHDHRTRDFGEGDGVVDEYNHRAMDGQTVDMDAPFLMPAKTGEPLQCMFPGDPTLPAGAVINCRCAVSHIVDDGF